MSFELAQISGNLFSLETWERIGKFLAVNIASGIVITILVLLILKYITGVNWIITSALILTVVLVSNALMLSAYEAWRGCNLQKS